MTITNEMAVQPQDVSPDTNINQTLRHLIERCAETDKSLYNAAEQIDNRGTKLLVKGYAQQHAQFTRQLQEALKQMGNTPPDNPDPISGVSRGLTDVKATMIVQRRDRQISLLQDALQSEDTTVQAYTDALQAGLPERIRTLVARQADRLRAIQRQLKLLANEASQRLVIRLYNQAGEAEKVVQQLQQAGFSTDQIYTMAIDQAARVYTADAQERGRSKRQTLTAMGLAGAGVGLVLGVLLGLAQHFLAPETMTFLPNSLIGTVAVVGVIFAVIGTIFGLIFGLLIGQNNSEDDAYLYAESLQDGDTLLAVFTDNAHRNEAERLVGLKHEREIKPAR